MSEWCQRREGQRKLREGEIERERDRERKRERERERKREREREVTRVGFKIKMFC